MTLEQARITAMRHAMPMSATWRFKRGVSEGVSNFFAPMVMLADLICAMTKSTADRLQHDAFYKDRK